jgi:allantoin racemase
VADGADAIVVGCFDDTGLATLRARLPCPVIGLGEAGMLNACLLGTRFAVVTTTEGSVPVIEGNIRAMGLWERCTGVHAARVPVLQLDSRIEEVRACIARIATSTDAASVVLGCAGMSPLAGDLAAGSPCRLVDPVRAAAALAVSLGESVIAGRQDIVAAN